jgi:2'-phosphotransferase
MKTIDQSTVFRLVSDNAKKRFELVYGHDSSPPKPKKQKAPKKKPVKVAAAAVAVEGTEAASSAVPPTTEASVEALGTHLAATSVEPEWKELEFFTLPPPEDGAAPDPRGAWYIRASQGHSLEVKNTNLEPIMDTPEGRARAGLMVHGTQWKLWDLLSECRPVNVTDMCRGAGPLPHGAPACASRSRAAQPPYL